MANKQISDLSAANDILPADLFVLEQDGTAKKLSGQLLISRLTALADGHGGIQSITWTVSGTSGNGQYHNATIHYADATTSTFHIRDGIKGDRGSSYYVHIRYSNVEPSALYPDISEIPDSWMGIYTGLSSTAPTSYTAYKWYKIKGDTGAPSQLSSSSVDYQAGSTGTVAPSGTWSSSVPIVPQGSWLWTRTTMNFNTGSPVVMYTASRQGTDGEGAAGSAVPLADTTLGEVGESMAFSREDHRHPTPMLHITSTITTLPTTISNASILSTMRVVNCVLGSPANVTSDIAWTTSDGEIALSGTMVASSSTTIDIDLAIF